MIGRDLAHYRVIERLGVGGMGEVYLAEDSRLQRRVALKVLPAHMAAEPERLERFAREAMAVGGLNHPNIVTIHSIEQVDDLQILVMELVEGQTLGEEIPEGGLSEERFFDIAIPLADAISAAHDRGVTHRDLKPSNVMITGDGRVKVVDFGLAKLRQETATRESTIMMDDDLTEAGRILGTYPYMAPEQIKGKPADHRADIFSLGIVLYEMATGERPFQGETSADLISSILRDQPPPTHEVNLEMPRHLDRIIDHCLEKDPDRRFQTAKDLRNELQSLRGEIESERILRTTSRGGRRPPAVDWSRLTTFMGTAGGKGRLVAGIAAFAVASAVALALYFGGGPPEPDAAGEASPVSELAAEPAEDRRPSLAVLFFQNLTGDPELDWLRIGLTEMLVTDLSQSPGLRVLATDQLYQILSELEALSTAVVSADLVEEIAERAGVEHVLLGSYVQAGGTLQVNATLKDPESGETLDAQLVQGAGESGVFSIVDQLSGEILDRLERAGHPELARRSGAQRTIESVTTSSVDAYRLYVEGMRLRRELKVEESLPLFQHAVELDPEFAMAYARLALNHETLGREQETVQALEQALAHSERLPPQERFYVEGIYYGRKRATYRQAVETLTEGLELYPDHQSARYQLALLYSYVERFEDAAQHLEELFRQGYDYDGLYNALAETYGAQGREDQGRRVLADLMERNPDRWSAHLILGWHLTSWGDPARAVETLDRAEELRPGSPFQDLARWRADIMQRHWSPASAAADEMVASPGRYWHWRGLVGQGIGALYRGDGRGALLSFESAANAYGNQEPLIGTARNLEAELLLGVDRPEEALERTAEALRVAGDDWPAWEATFWAALAEERLGRSAEADRLAAELEEIARGVPGQVEERFHRRLLGLLARERGQHGPAVRLLREAESMLPARGFAWHRHRLPDHVSIWYELATAYREAGDAAEAEALYQRILDSGVEHMYRPVVYARSFYFLGRLKEARGDRDGARDAYRGFVELWEDGDLDRDRLSDARRRSSALD